MSEFENILRGLELDEGTVSDVLAAHIREVNAAGRERIALVDRKNTEIAALNARISELEHELAEIKSEGARNLSFEPPRLEVLDFGKAQ